MDQEELDDYHLEISNLFAERLDIDDSSNPKNRSLVRNLGESFPVQECVTEDHRRNSRSTVNDSNNIWEQRRKLNSSRGDTGFNQNNVPGETNFGWRNRHNEGRNSSNREFGWRNRDNSDRNSTGDRSKAFGNTRNSKSEFGSGWKNRGVGDRKSKDDAVSRNERFALPYKTYNTRNDASEAESTKGRSSFSSTRKMNMYEKPATFQYSRYHESGHFDKRNEFNREPHVGSEYLAALSDKQPHEIICEILRPKAKISYVLNKKELQADHIMLIMKTARKLCDSDFKDNKIQVLHFFCESPLLDHISRYLGEIGMETNENTVKNLNSFVSDLVAFYSAVIKTMPTIAMDKDFSKFLAKTELSLQIIKTYLQVEMDETIAEKLANLKETLNEEINIREKRAENPHEKRFDLGDLPPPDNFRELSLYPTQEDLNRHDSVFIRPNKIKGGYEDVEHYLDVQFRLIREDFIGPLRTGLRNYRDSIVPQGQGKPKYKYDGVRFYQNVRIEGMEFTKENNIGYVVNFNLNGRLRNIKWEYSKWFMFGSLLLFTHDNFQSFFFATVFNRDIEKLQSGRILVTLIGNKPLKQSMLNRSLLMVESEVYFEPYWLVMKALKEYNEDNFPMKQFIVEGNTAVDLPPYMKKMETVRIYGHSVNLVQNENWPHHSVIGFDEHQFKAFKTTLTSNFTVIQGPPGTGKTYLGLKIVETLLNNAVTKRLVEAPCRLLATGERTFRTPILLVCYTNHALDQFLEGVLKFTQSIVRVGGQSKSEDLKPFNLRGKKNISYLRREARELFPAMDQCREEIQELFHHLKTKDAEKRIIETPLGILCYDVLSGVMKPWFKREISNETILCEWLLPLDVNYDTPIQISNWEEKTTKNVDVDSTKSTQVDEFYGEVEDETIEADLLVNEDDVFVEREIRQSDIFVRYCVSAENLEKSLRQTRTELFDLESNPCQFDDFSEYHNSKYQLIRHLQTTDFRYRMLNHHLRSAPAHSTTTESSHYYDVWKMPLDQRWNMYWSWVSQLKESFTKELKNLEALHRSKSQQYEELKQLEDYHVVKNSSVVGMTTTCAARLQLLLKTLSPAIVIVEEAAEVLEAHIVVSLSKNCEHVILIGDHKQLKPSAAVFELMRKYNINVSLFERMINNNMDCPQLQIQHRMRPEISSLIVPSIYPNLENHESVLKYPSVTGITKNLFFIEHEVHEEQVDNSSSRKNRFEAEFMIELCRYILLQGYSPDQITILTTYAGQMFHLREMKRDYSIMKNVRVIVVDKYQGEENDIILLSLVRSNEDRKVGFLSIENRVCVALSRAKIGLYIIGNMDILSDFNVWKNVKEELIKQEAIGPKLELYCDKHDVYTKVSCKKDFNNVMEGGCHNFCHEMMDCGHKCQLLCHKIDMEHLERTCRQICLKKCVEGHRCRKYCYLDCGQCTVPVERSLPCGHTVTLHCFEDYEKHLCQVDVGVILEHCSHEVKKKCHQSVEEVKCTFPCEDRLECGHQCLLNCHKTDDPDHIEYKCRKPCDKINRGCSREHNCEKLCFEDCGKCKVHVEFPLKCGHTINLMCSADLDRVKCYNRCVRKCTECNADCPKLCHEDCKPCKKKVKKRVEDCGHEIKLECSVVPERKLCRKPCKRLAPCGHKCKSRCGEPCDSYRCREIVKSTCVQSLCGHGFANVPCCEKNEEINAEEVLQYCTEPCVALLKCGDLCTGTCGSCWQGRLHQTCENKCGNVLVCGHSCTVPCRNVCPPCTKNCQYKCKHSRCPKKCGVPCVPCREKCEWSCIHKKCTRKCGDICDREPCYEPCVKKLKCGHDCIGFCGEPCPDKCRICDKDEVTTILFGNEDEEDARFVFLEDCNHIIESEAMDRYISLPAEQGEIVMKVCPVCKTPISKTLRYMNQVKKVYRDIQNVKRKVYGNDKEMKELRTQLQLKLQDLDLANDQLHRNELLLIIDTVLEFAKRFEMRGKSSYISSQMLRAMHFFTDMFSSIISRLKDLSGCIESAQKSRIFKKLDFILKRVDPEALQINTQQVDDIRRELNRYHRLVDYCVCINKPEYLSTRNTPNVIEIEAGIAEILYGLKCYDDEQDAQISELFEKLRVELDSVESLSQEEKRMIHAAMAKDFHGGVNSKGHWFTCTNGHYYCITECGGAMQESKCPDCGEKIGGTQHRYVETVRLASDMDGATRPAWFTGVDMRNFNFN